MVSQSKIKHRTGKTDHESSDNLLPASSRGSRVTCYPTTVQLFHGRSRSCKVPLQQAERDGKQNQILHQESNSLSHGWKAVGASSLVVRYKQNDLSQLLRPIFRTYGFIAEVPDQVKGYSERYEILKKEQAQETHVTHVVNSGNGNNLTGGGYDHSAGYETRTAAPKLCCRRSPIMLHVRAKLNPPLGNSSFATNFLRDRVVVTNVALTFAATGRPSLCNGRCLLEPPRESGSLVPICSDLLQERAGFSRRDMQ